MNPDMLNVFTHWSPDTLKAMAWLIIGACGVIIFCGQVGNSKYYSQFRSEVDSEGCWTGRNLWCEGERGYFAYKFCALAIWFIGGLFWLFSLIEG